MLINKNEVPVVAMDFMNATHFEDVDIINNLFESILAYDRNPSASSKQSLVSQYNLWINHTIEHFASEEKMMMEKRFPAYSFHKTEHDKILELMKSYLGNFTLYSDIQELKKYFIEELPAWLTNHIKSMDTVTAIFLKTGLSPCSMR